MLRNDYFYFHVNNTEHHIKILHSNIILMSFNYILSFAGLDPTTARYIIKYEIRSSERAYCRGWIKQHASPLRINAADTVNFQILES